MRVALVGAGNIAARYAASIVAAPRLELGGATDLDGARAEELVAAQGGRVYPDLASVLADDDVNTVVNLTVPQAHYEVAATALAAGKHVHNEKPLALRHEEARQLIDLATENGVRLSSAPATLLGEAQQTLWKLVRDGAIGHVRAVYAEANWGRIEDWHPDPRTLYAVGPHVDVGVYPLTILTAMFGPVRRVQSFATTLQAERMLLDGTAFVPAAPDFVVATLEHEEGVLTRLTATLLRPAEQAGRARAARRRGVAPPGVVAGGELDPRAPAARRRVHRRGSGAGAVRRDRLGPRARRSGRGDRGRATASLDGRARRPRRRGAERDRRVTRAGRRRPSSVRLHQAGADGMGA